MDKQDEIVGMVRFPLELPVTLATRFKATIQKDYGGVANRSSVLRKLIEEYCDRKEKEWSSHDRKSGK
jgi:metal-responsive CopG/Arc/MetJ family transcriptional regulator